MDQLYTSILADSDFQRLQRRRERLCLWLSLAVFSAFLGFILLIAYAPGALATPLAPGMITTRGVPLGSSVILFGFALTGLFVWRSNREFDAEMARILARHVARD
ncbi:MAG: DUF485 domain-containing protein [Gammaproteobacteria bacterium]